MYEISYGSKYEKGLNITEIAKRVRDDIKAAEKAGALPKGIKTSVRISRYSMGQSLNVTIKAMPGVQVMNRTRLEHDRDFPHRYPEGPGLELHTAEARAVVDALEALVGAYNFNGSEIQVDYFHVNFYGRVDIDWHLERAEREAFLAEKAA